MKTKSVPNFLKVVRANLICFCLGDVLFIRFLLSTSIFKLLKAPVKAKFRKTQSTVFSRDRTVQVQVNAVTASLADGVKKWNGNKILEKS